MTGKWYTFIAAVLLSISSSAQKQYSGIYPSLAFYNNEGECYKAPILGNISMDLLVCDITIIPDDCTCVGHEAVLLDDNYTINDMAAESNTIPYEILTGLTYNSPRMNVTYSM